MLILINYLISVQVFVLINLIIHLLLTYLFIRIYIYMVSIIILLLFSLFIIFLIRFYSLSLNKSCSYIDQQTRWHIRVFPSWESQLGAEINFFSIFGKMTMRSFYATIIEMWIVAVNSNFIQREGVIVNWINWCFPHSLINHYR